MAEKTNYHVKFGMERLELNLSSNNINCHEPTDLEEIYEIYAA